MIDHNTGFVRVAAATPLISLANAQENANSIIAIIERADHDRAGIVCFPELAITGYTCRDLICQDRLYEAQMSGLQKILKTTSGLSCVVIIGIALRFENGIYNCAAVIQNGRLRGIVPKMTEPLPENRPYEVSFIPGDTLPKGKDCVRIFGATIPFGKLIFEDEARGLSIGVEIGDDMEKPCSPAVSLSMNGADIIFNPSASKQLAGSSNARRRLVSQLTATLGCGYVLSSGGICESVQDNVFAGHNIIAEDGEVLSESDLFSREHRMTYSEIDFQGLCFKRMQRRSPLGNDDIFKKIALDPVRVVNDDENLIRDIPSNPFIPRTKPAIDERCDEIFDIQANALARRVEHTKAAKIVLGISGGLDSTLALLVCTKAHQLLKKAASDIITVTMPGFGTTDSTYHNALTLMRKLGTDAREINIASSVRMHFSHIGHDEKTRDVTYENAQARERTQILMDIANDEGGFVVGTGDLSEAALGWCTFNGDHMSMYNVNCDVPKTLIRYIVNRIAEKNADDHLLADTLYKILDTPISPELLPPTDEGAIQQKTEDSIGPYELHDFFLYHTIKDGMDPDRLMFVACQTFANGPYTREVIERTLATFYRRFFSQQFKRNCVPDGPQVGTVCLSPRGAWSMPSDAASNDWTR